MHENVEETIIALMEEMRELLEKYSLLDHSIAGPKMERVSEIKKEINRYGWHVESKVSIADFQTLKAEVEVILYKPKGNLSPEDARLYDEWFLKANKSENSSKK